LSTFIFLYIFQLNIFANKDILNEAYFKDLKKRISSYTYFINNQMLSFKDLEESKSLKNDLADLKDFINILIEELKIVEYSLENNISYNIKIPFLFRTYIDYYKANKDYILLLSSLVDLSFKEEFEKQETYLNKLNYYIRGIKLFDFEDYSKDLDIETRVSKFILACSQMIYDDHNNAYDYKIDDFIKLFLKDKNLDFYNLKDISKYGIYLNSQYSGIKKSREEEYISIAKYMLETELYNSISSLILLLKTYHKFNNMNVSYDSFYLHYLRPVFNTINKDLNINYSLLHITINKALKNFDNYYKESIFSKFEEETFDNLTKSYNKTIDTVNEFCSVVKNTADINKKVFSCLKVKDFDSVKENEFSYYEDELKIKYSNYLGEDIKNESDCQALLDIKYREDKKIYLNGKDKIDYLIVQELLQNPVFLLSSSIEYKNNPARYFLNNKDLINDKCIKGEGVLFDKIDKSIFVILYQNYYNVVIDELKTVLKELEVLYNHESSIKKINLSILSKTIEDRLKSSPSLIINVLENSIYNKKIKLKNDLELEKILCTILRNINRKESLKKEYENIYKILIISGFIFSRFNFASNSLLVINTITILSSVLLSSSKIINFLEIVNLEKKVKQFLYTNNIVNHNFLIESLNNLKELKENELKETVLEVFFTSLLGLQSIAQFKKAFKSYKDVLKFQKNNPKKNINPGYIKPNLTNVNNKNYYLFKDWLSQIIKCKGNSFADDLIKIAIPSAVVGNIISVVPYVYLMPDDLYIDFTEVIVDTVSGTLISTARNIAGLRSVGLSNKAFDYSFRYLLLAGWGILKVGINNIYYYKFENDRADIDRYIVSRVFGESVYSAIVSPISSLTLLKLLKGISCLYPKGVKGMFIKYGIIFSSGYLMSDIFHRIRFSSEENIYLDQEGFLFIEKESVDTFVNILENYSNLTFNEKEELFNKLKKSIWDKTIWDDNSLYPKVIYIDEEEIKIDF